MAAKVKKESTRSAKFAEGGDTPMFGHQNSGRQRAAVTGHDNGPAQSQGTDGKFAGGGSTKMHGYAPSVPATAGITSAR